MQDIKCWKKLPLETNDILFYNNEDANSGVNPPLQKGCTLCHTTRTMEELLKTIRNSANPDEVVIRLISFSEQILADRHIQKDVDIPQEKNQR